jgi:cell division protein FtsQ
LEETANAETGEPFLRTRQRVPVRRRGGSRFASRFSWKNRWVRIVAVLIILAGLGLLAAVTWGAKSFLLRNRHFMLASSQNIQITGNRVVTNPQVLAFFAPDVGHSIFRVPLAERQAQLQQIRWVGQATVMRLWPNRLRVNVLERVPVAFARDGNSVRLVDGEGVLLDLPYAAAQHYSFPVLTGITSGDPLSLRAARVAMYRQFVQALDAGGGHISATLSEVDLSDPEDVRAIFAGNTRQPLVHFGASDFLPRYQAYRAHLAEWLQQYPQLRSVDMRYGRQVVLDTGTEPVPPATPLVLKESAAAAATSTISTVSNPGVVAPRHVRPHSKTSASKRKTRTAASKKLKAKHHVVNRKHARAPERGHSVRHPIMHVVKGM